MYQAGPVEILPFLYLGSAFHASKKDMLDGMGISALLNVSSNCPNHFEGVYQYKCIPVEDNHKEDISSWFIEAIEFIGKFQFLRRIRGTCPEWHPAPHSALLLTRVKVVHHKGNKVLFGMQPLIMIAFHQPVGQDVDIIPT